MDAMLLECSRILFAAAKDGLMPAFGNLMSVSGGFKQWAIISGDSLLIIYPGVALSLMRLRKTASEQKSKTFRVPGGYIIPLIAVAGIIWLLSNSSRP